MQHFWNPWMSSILGFMNCKNQQCITHNNPVSVVKLRFPSFLPALNAALHMRSLKLIFTGEQIRALMRVQVLLLLCPNVDALAQILLCQRFTVNLFRCVRMCRCCCAFRTLFYSYKSAGHPPDSCTRPPRNWGTKREREKREIAENILYPPYTSQQIYSGCDNKCEILLTALCWLQCIMAALINPESVVQPAHTAAVHKHLQYDTTIYIPSLHNAIWRTFWNPLCFGFSALLP